MIDSTLLADVRWTFLTADGRTWLNTIAAAQEVSETVVKSSSKRQVVRALGVYCKIIHYRGADAIFKTLHKGNARKEGEQTRRMAEMGLSVPEVLGYGAITQNGLLCEEVLLTREVPAGLPLQEILDHKWSQTPPQRKRCIVEGFGRFIETLHRAGVMHKDPHFGNILLVSDADGDTFVTLDTDKAVLKGRALNLKERLSNLARFPSLQYHASQNEVMRFLASYGAAAGLSGTTFIRQFSDEFFRHASRIYRKYANRCLTTNARFTKEHLAGFSVYRKAGNDVAELLKELLPSPDKLMEQGEIVKEGRTIRAARVQIGGKDYFLKRYNPKSFWYRFRNAFRRSRATKVWLNAWAFRYRNLPTAEPLICLEERHYRLLGRSYLLTEYVDDSEPLHLGWPHYDEQRKASLLVHISLLLAKMHRLGCIHGDLKWSNLLVRGEQVHLVDLDGSRILRRKDLPLFRKDIDRFIKDMEKYSAADFRKAFLALWQKRIR